MKLLGRGAEAELYLAKQGKKQALLKRRVEKGYRCRELDDEIRGSRTTLEARLLNKARSLGVNTPRVYGVDKGAKEIEMEFIEGSRVKDVLNAGNFKGICPGIGTGVAKMHSFDLVHGDLTTSNMLLSGKELFFIDFGLGASSRKVEDKAVDLLVFKKTFEATHADLMPKGWEKIVQGYEKGMGKAGNAIVKHIASIEKRARYH